MQLSRKIPTRKLQFEKLESRKLLASDLYTLASRPGLSGPIGSSSGNDIAQNESYIAVGRPFEGYSEPQNGELGEVHIHSPATGALLRTIANPDPELVYHFGEAVALFGDLLVVGGTGLGFTDEDGEEGPFGDKSGRAYIYSASTGQLLHELLPEYEENPDFSLSLDRFGAAVGIYGDYVVVGAPGARPYDQDNYNWGHVFVYSASSGNLLRTLNNPLEPVNASPTFSTFGSVLSVQGTKLVIGDPSNYKFGNNPIHPESGSVYVYDVTTGALQHTLQVPAEFSVPNTHFGFGVDVFDQNIVASITKAVSGGAGPFQTDSILVYNATTGGWLRTISVGQNEAFGFPSIWESSVAVHYSKIASPPAPVVARVYDVNSGTLVDTAVAPINTNFSYLGTTDLFGDRLLASHFDNASDDKLVFAYTVSVSDNNPPTDISLSPSTVPENSAAGTVVGLLSATDPDAGDTFSYSLINDAAGRFSVVGNELRVIGGLNFEVAATHNITVQVTDSSGDTYSEVIPVTITNINEPPTAINLTNDKVLHTASTGSVVGSFSAVDPDAADTASFELMNDAGGRFNLVGSILTVGDASLLNTALTHPISVRVTDSGGLTHTQSFFIKVISAPTDLQLVDSYVVEGSANGTPIAIINDPAPFNSVPQVESFASNSVSFGGRTAFANTNNALGNRPDVGIVYIRNDVTGEIELTLLPSEPEVARNFGLSLAIDGNLIAVGSREEYANGTDAGYVSIFDTNTGVQITSFTGSGEQYGRSLALFGSRIAIGGFGGEGVLIYDFVANSAVKFIGDPVPGVSDFGARVAFSSSGQLIVSAPEYLGEGRVYVFSATTYTLENTLSNPEPSNAGIQNDRFGEELAVLENTILVSANGQDSGGINESGAVYRFNLLNGQLFQTLVDPNPVVNGYFGTSIQTSAMDIAISRDEGQAYLFNGLTGILKSSVSGVQNVGVSSLALNADGLVVGYDPSLSSYGGEARIYDLETGQPLSTFRVFDNTPTANNTFTLLDNAGGRFAIAGDQLIVANGALIDAEQASSYTIQVQVTDGTGLTFSKSFQIKVIGLSDNAPTDVTIDTSTVLESTVRHLHNPNPGKTFGGIVSTSGNVAAVGVLDLSFPQAEPNRVEIYNTSTGSLVQTLVNPNPSPNGSTVDGRFGERLLLSGNTAVVSAPAANAGGFQNAGQAFVFDSTTGALIHTLNSPVPNASGQFGRSLALNEYFIAVGASDDFGAEQSGSVYLFDPATGVSLFSLHNPTPAAFDGFGQSISVDGSRFVVGVPGYGSDDFGRAYIYQYYTNFPGPNAILARTLDNPSPQIGDLFGAEVVIENGFVAVSAPSDNTGAENAGQVYLYNFSTGALLRTIANPNPDANDRFGDQIKIEGNYLIVSSANASGVLKAGQLHVFDVRTGGLLATLDNPSPAPNDLFGTGSAFNSVSIDGTRLVIGASGDDNDGPNQGLIYVYDLSYGGTVGTLSTVDLDSADVYTYTLTNNAGGRFAIDGDKLIVADANRLDYEANTSHTVTVQVTDAAGLTFTKNLTIQVTNVDETYAPVDIVVGDSRVLENAINGTPIAVFDNPTPPTNAINDGFGGAVASFGGYLAIGATSDDQGGAGSGSVFLVSPEDGSLVRTITNPNPQYTGSFGGFNAVFSTGIAGTPNRLVVGAASDGTDAPNSGKAFVFDPANGNLLFTLSPPVVQVNQRFGSTVAIDSSFIVVGSFADQIHVFNANTGAFLYSIAPPNATNFGVSIAISDNRIIVSDDQTAGLNGMVYVYDATTGALAYSISPPNASNALGTGNLLFGGSISVDSNRIAVGSVGNDAQGRDAGAVFLFNLNNGSLLQTIYEQNPGKSNGFGSKVLLKGDRLAVYSNADDMNGFLSGRVHLFDSLTGNTIRTLDDPQSALGSQFGNALAFTGSKLFVGVRNNNTNLSRPGQFVAYDAFDGLALGIKTIDANLNDTFTYQLLDDAGGRFGLVGNQIVVANGSLLDYESNPSHTVVLQVTDSSGETFSKSIVINLLNVSEAAPTSVVFKDRTVLEHAPIGTPVGAIDNPEPGQTEGFGGAIAVVGNSLVVGNSRDDIDGIDAGIVYIKNTNDGAILQTLHNPNPDPGDLFGGAVAAAGNILVVGAPQDDTLATNAGRAYVFNLTTGLLLHKLSYPNPGANQGFGASVSTDGSRVVVGTENGDRAFVYNATTGLLTNELNVPNSGFGSSVSISANFIAIGAPRYDSAAAIDIGRVYVYSAFNGGLVQTLDSPIQSNGAYQFGSSVSISGSRVVVGSPGYDNGTTDVGRAYMYYAGADGVALLETFENPTPDAGDRFGKQVVLGNNRLAVGMEVAANAAVYVFDRDDGSLEKTISTSSPGATFFGRALAFQESNVTDPVLHIGSSILTGGFESGQVESYDVFSGLLVPSFVVSDATSGDRFTYELLNSAGGRYSLSNGRLFVASNGLDFEPVFAQSMNTITIRVTDSSGLSITRNPFLQLIDVPETIAFAKVDSVVLNGSLANLNRSGIRSIQLNFSQPVTVIAPTGLSLRNHTTNAVISLSAATLTGNGTASVTWELNNTVLPNGRYTAELAANQTVNNLGYRLESSYAFEFYKRTGDVNGDGLVNMADYATIGANFSPIPGLRFRQGDADGNGFVNLLDYSVVGLNFAPAPLAAIAKDFGDAPETGTNYPTTLARNGARHATGTIYLGASVDSEADGQPNTDATGDGADENGVVWPTLLRGQVSSLSVQVAAPIVAYVSVWIDLNGDGDWGDAGELVLKDALGFNGNNSYSIHIPGTTTNGQKLARVRVNSVATIGATGFAANGEVEDYLVTIGEPSLMMSPPLPKSTRPSLGSLPGMPNDSEIARSIGSPEAKSNAHTAATDAFFFDYEEELQPRRRRAARIA